ncbi:AfsR/SARP family transcriptional regulator [Actinomadura roseirufa]|uniref:AfsR/SARP family transcriptional regulator n=1 Tax=Actinomadura roseirufa TaxID=2094049 RepID=UPI0013F14530|nr:BTAD domain-containing putative transcriptional regulator [Actinomadura roseirufa]
MEFGLLGPLEVRRDGAPVPVSAPKLRVVLATLLLRANRDVSLGELAENVWGPDGPARPTASLRVFLMRLRQLCEAPELIRTTPDGYRLEIDDEALDLLRFGNLVERGRALAAGGDLGRAESALDEAMRLWRAEPLADVPSEALHAEAARLQELRLRAEHERFEVKLRAGLHHGAIGRLRELAAENPLREDLWGQLMLALYRAGRQAEAVAAYQAVSGNLARELGVVPGPALRELHGSILVADPELATPGPPREAATVTGGEPAEPAPAEPVRAGSQLPPAIGNFVGRGPELDRAVRLLRGGGQVSVPVVTVSGPPGVGKTAFAVRAAHRLSEAFPDGRFFVDLHAYSAVRGPSTPAVLARLLRALGHAAEHIPVDEDELVAAYRTALRGKRVLITLDNAASAGQVRPLIPGEPGCALLVTARDELTALAARDGARRIRLDTLSERESAGLLTAILGERVTTPQRAAAAQLAELCGRLPLALRIAASNLAGSHRPDIGGYIRRFLEDGRVRALALDGDEHIAVARAFDLSYVSLPPEARAMFRLFALFPGPDVTPETMAVLAGGTRREAGRALERLAAASLVQRLPGNRYQMHDLVSEYAADRVRAEDGEQDAAAARDRLFGWQLRAVGDAVGVLYPEFATAPPEPGDPSGDVSGEASGEAVPPFVPRDRTEALRWLDAERPGLVAVIEHCAEHGPRPVAWRLAEAMAWYLGIRGHHTEYLTAANAGLRAARDAGDPVAETAMVGSLVWEHRNLGDLATALRYVTDALDHGGAASPGLPPLTVWHGSVRLEMGDLEGARTCFAGLAGPAVGPEPPPFLAVAAPLGLGAVELLAGRGERALTLLEEALDAATRAETTVQRVECLMVVGRCHTLLGRYERAAELLRAAVEQASTLGSRYHQADCLAYLATALNEGGDLAGAAEAAREALARSEGLRNRCITVNVWNALGGVRRNQGRAEDAIEAHEHAVAASKQGTVHPYNLSMSLIGLARAHLAAGRAPESYEHAQAAVAIAREHGFGGLEARAVRLLASLEPAS